MAISYFKSSQVHVFPCAYRGTSAQNAIDPEARLNTEKNLTNTGNNLKGTYLISKTTSGTVTKVNVVIGGYYFELTMDTSVSGNITWASLQDKYLAIKTIDTPIVSGGKNTRLLAKYDGTATTGEYLDVDDEFKGLAIVDSSSIPQNATAYIKVADSNGNVLNDAYLPDISSSTGSKSLASSGCTATGDHAVSLGLGLTGATNPVAGQMVIGSYNTNTNANDKIFIVGNGTAEGTRSDAFTVGTDGSINANNKFTVATNGNTAIAGTLRVTGATALTSATLSSTLEVTGAATFNGATISSLTVNGNASVNGNISCTNLEAGQQVKCEGLSVDQIGSESDNISLGRTLLPQNNNLSLGNSSYYFNTAYVNQISTEGQLKLTGASIVLDTINTVGTIYAPKNLYVGGSSGSRFSDNGNIHATKNISAGGTITAEGKIHANDDIIIKSGKHLDLSGTDTGDIKLKAPTGSSSSTPYIITENGIYSIIVTPRESDSSFTTTMALTSVSTDAIYGPILINTSGVNQRIKATKSGTTWVINFMVGTQAAANVSWTVVKIASL